MTVLAIIILLALGVALLFVEVLIIPGTTVVGIIGLILMGIGVYYAYDSYGKTEGVIALVSSFGVSAILIVIGFKSGTWKKLANKSVIDSKVNVVDKTIVDVGSTGTLITDLRPVGKAMFNGNKVEVKSQEGFLEKDQEIEVVKIVMSNIIVKLKL
ncbi:MAG: hypothetical protein IIA45_10615 [Bacteroidetes bacterium]|nr:hypothetical protein [Bacteroidota bacterium]